MGLLATLLASSTAAADSEPELVDTPPEPSQAPTAQGFNPTPEAQLLLPAVRVFLQSPTRGVTFFVLTSSLRFRGVGPVGGVRVGVDRAGVTFRPGFGVYSGRTRVRDYELICQSPCEVSLPIGDYALGLSLDGGAPVVAKPHASLTRRSIVDGRYIDRSRIRKAGWWVFGAGFIAGVVVMLTGFNYDEDSTQIESVKSGPLVGAGIGLMSASIVIGVPMLTRDDRASVAVYPLE